MKAKICPICGAKMRCNGKNKSGAQRNGKKYTFALNPVTMQKSQT